MPGGKVQSNDDGPCIILTNNQLEVVADRIDAEDPSCVDFVVSSAESDDETAIATFTKQLEAATE